MNPYYTDYSEYLNRFYPGVKVQKISVNTGRSCPNRDGTIGIGGCIYCDNSTFTPGYCSDTKSVAEQIADGKRFFARKYPDMKYLAYFQSFTPTHSSPDGLKRDLAEAMEDKDVVGVIVASRPDCLPDEVLKVLQDASTVKRVFMELGVETLHDKTLRIINRGHTSRQAVEAIERIKMAGLETGVHLIEGLPGETPEMMFESARQICDLHVDSVKFHQLQVIRGTILEKFIKDKKMSIYPFTLDTYLDFCVKLVKCIPREIAIERFLASSPPDMVISPKWGIKNFEFTHRLLHRLSQAEAESKLTFNKSQT